MILADVLSGLVEMDTDLLLAINGWRAEWADLFMYAFSGKWIWIPLYASILYVIARNLHWKVAIGCAVAIALTIIFADQIGATLIRPWVCRLRPANPENPISEFVHIVNGYRGGRYGFPSCHAANTFGLAFFLFYLFRNRALNWFIMVWALLTCYSRSYLGVHYPETYWRALLSVLSVRLFVTGFSAGCASIGGEKIIRIFISRFGWEALLR